MKRMLLTGTVFMAAVLIGVGLTMFVAPNAEADKCAPVFPPIHDSTCDTGPLCSEPTPYYLIQCDGRILGSGEPCDCYWIGCWSGSGC